MRFLPGHLPYEVEEACVIAYQRILASERLLALHNFRNRESEVRIPEGYHRKVIGNYDRSYDGGGRYRMQPYECIVLYGTGGDF